MFFKIIFSYIFGYLKLEIEGYYIERFINKCKLNGIIIWSVKREKSIKLKFKVSVQEFRNICKIAKITKCKVKIVAKKGFPFLLYRYKKRKIFAIFLFLIITFMIISSGFVWNVEIREENNEILENIEQDIANVGLKVGEKKSEIDTTDIVNKIRLQRNDIAWMGIELKGTNAIVKIVKASNKPDIVDDEEYCNIVSDKAGIVTKINAQSGTANVKVGDTVNKGEVLINGWMEGKYTGIRYTHARGEIEAKVWYTKYKRINYNTTERIETDNEENHYAIKFNNFKINFSKGLSKFKIYDTIETEHKIRLFSDFYLPISIIKTTYKEINEQQKKYTLEEAKNIGIEELQEELNNEIEDKNNILTKNINTYENNGYIDVYVTYEVLENIGTNEKIVF